MKLTAGFLGLSGVALGAFGAHLLKERLATAGMDDAWQTAVHYQLIHAVALYTVSARSVAVELPDKWLRRAGWFWSSGTVFFSGSIYILAMGGPRWVGPITPIGGVALVAGWLCVIISGLRFPKDTETS